MHQYKKETKDIPQPASFKQTGDFCYSEAKHVPLKENSVD